MSIFYLLTWIDAWFTLSIKIVIVFNEDLEPRKNEETRRGTFSSCPGQWYSRPPETAFVNLLRSSEIDSQPGLSGWWENHIWRTGPQGYFGWQNRKRRACSLESHREQYNWFLKPDCWDFSEIYHCLLLISFGKAGLNIPPSEISDGILEQSMGTTNRVGIGLLYRPNNSRGI
jgi:hypothetical protein